MSIKDLFGKQKSDKVVSSADFDALASDVESVAYATAVVKQQRQFTPPIDYSDPKNFAFYGLAEEYYARAIEHIYGTYPYDGSKAEKLEWYNSGSAIDQYIFDNEYPRAVGHVSMSAGGWGSVSDTTDLGLKLSDALEYIAFKGGPNRDADASTIHASFPDNRGNANVWNEAKKRVNNLLLSGGYGNTVEFFMRRHGGTDSNGREVVLDIDNGVPSSSVGYGRLICSYLVSGGDGSFKTLYASGSYATDVTTGIDAEFTSIDELNDGKWHHYAFRYFNTGSDDFACELFVDGASRETVTSDSGSVAGITGSMYGQLGALRTSWPNVPSSDLGWGKLSASIDEFRFWKTKRSAEDIGRYHIDSVGGGVNTDDATTDLGVYFKFNEGIISTSSAGGQDAVILDYSGRISNGAWTGMAATSRASSSAINEYIAENLRTTELYASESADPIIYSYNPLVEAYRLDRENKALEWDLKNNMSLYNSIPDHIINDDAENENNLKAILQILASYLDNLHIMLKYIPKLHEPTLYSGSVGPSNIAKRAVSSMGLTTPELFVEADVIEAIASRNDKKVFEEEISDIKNAIYQNLYHALATTMKKKGTLAGFRNVLRCFGIDEEIVKINLYADNMEYKLDDRYTPYERNEKYLDFHGADRHSATVHQFTDAASPANSLSYIPGLTSSAFLNGNGGAWTMEASVKYPKEMGPGFAQYFSIPFQSASIAGTYGVTADIDAYTRPGGPDSAEMRLFSVRPTLNSKDAYFVAYGAAIGEITSSVYRDVYDESQWHFALSLYPENYPDEPLLSGSQLSSSTAGYIFKFDGRKVNQGYVEETFSLSQSVPYVSGSTYISASKRLFCGANKENFTGSTDVMRSDCRLHSVAAWYDKLSDDEIRWHAFDPGNYGRVNPRDNFAYAHTPNTQIPKSDTLAALWTFDNVTGSGADTYFTVNDVSSGSAPQMTARLGMLSGALGYFFPGRGAHYLANDTDAVSIEYPTAVRLKGPGAYLGEDMVSIGDMDQVYTQDTRPITYYFAAEKSLSATVTEQIVNMFAGILEFNNLIGDPVNRFRPSYKPMEKMRQAFFERVRDVATTERYIEYYKWIDSSIGTILQQLVPASADFSNGMRTLIESHALERNKHWTKFPSTDFPTNELESSVFGINELKYSWKEGKSGSQSESPLWWKERAERSILSIGDDAVTSNLDSLREVAVREAKAPREYLVYDADSASTYPYKKYPMKALTPVYDLLGAKLSSAFGSSSQAPLKSKFEDQAEKEDATFWQFATRSYAYNVENELTTTASDNLGNYSNQYEIVQTSGRKDNNKWFVDQQGVSFENNEAYYISGAVDGAVRERTPFKSIIVERFSAPGSPEVMSEGFLDAEAAEFSPYNALPWRNLVPRRQHDLWLRTHADQFGVSSTDATVASWHKVNRNTLHRVENTASEDCTADYDTWEVTRAIPRSDRNYTWITSSMLSKSTMCEPFVGYWPEGNSIYYGSTAGFVEIDAFVSGGAAENGGDYWGSNEHIIPAVDIDLNIISAISANDEAKGAGAAEVLRYYLNSRTGPWQYATWNQLRSGDSEIARRHKLNNIISVIDVNTPIMPNENIIAGKHANTFTNYREPAFGMMKPNIIHMLYAGEKASLRYPYESERKYFANVGLDNRLNLVYCEDGAHEKIIQMYSSPLFNELIMMRHSQNVFPKAANVGLSRTRDRSYYTEIAGSGVRGYDRGPNDRRKLWDGTAALRGRTIYSALNSVGMADSRNGVWPLDASDAGTAVDGRGIGGELSNYSASFDFKLFFSDGAVPGSTASILYAHRIEARSGSTADCPLDRNQPVDRGMPTWSAGIEAGKNPWYSSYEDYAVDVRPHAQGMSTISEFRISEHMPYYIDSNNGDFRKKNRKYLQLDGALVSESAASETSTPSENFFKHHAHGDDVVNYSVLNEQNADLAPLARITLKCDGVKKLIPYNGFYPMQRTAQMAELFSQSYAPNIVGNGDEVATEPEKRRLQALLQPWFAPGILYNSIKAGVACDWAAYTASAITHLTHSSGCPLYGVMTYPGTYRLPFESLIEFESTIPAHTASQPDQRAPEDGFRLALAAPSHYYDDGVQDTTYFSWNGQVSSNRYRMAMHNFLAEVPKFFLESNGLTTIASQEEAKYQPFVSGTTYYMDVALAKTNTFQMVKDPYAAAASDEVSETCTNENTDIFSYHGRYFGPALSMSIDAAQEASGSAIYAVADPATAQYAPPYLFGKSLTRLSFTPDESRKYSTAEILANLSYVEYNDEMADKFVALTDIDPRVSPYAAWVGRMPLSASIKFDARGRESITKYDANGVPTEIYDPESTNKDFWAIYPRFETPMLNFSHIDPSDCNRGPYGMWINHGRIPSEHDGVFMSIEEPDRNFLTTNGGESLLEACGFKPTKKRLGVLAEKRELSEAIVAIPFTDFSQAGVAGAADTVQVDERHFIAVDEKQWKRQVAEVNAGNGQDTTIANTINMMRKYVLPPNIDFMTYSDIPPFVMYFMEFGTRFDQEDLADMWQGVMPKAATRAEKQSVTISHDLADNEFFGGKRPPENMRWLIFKVKQKAEKNYYKITRDALDDERFQFQFNHTEKEPEYSYNWPYDYCSLVEAAKVDVTLDWISDSFTPLSEVDNVGKKVDAVIAKGVKSAGLDPSLLPSTTVPNEAKKDKGKI